MDVISRIQLLPYGLAGLPLHGKDNKELGKALNAIEYQLEQSEAVFFSRVHSPGNGIFLFLAVCV